MSNEVIDPALRTDPDSAEHNIRGERADAPQQEAHAAFPSLFSQPEGTSPIDWAREISEALTRYVLQGPTDEGDLSMGLNTMMIRALGAYAQTVDTTVREEIARKLNHIELGFLGPSVTLLAAAELQSYLMEIARTPGQ